MIQEKYPIGTLGGVIELPSLLSPNGTIPEWEEKRAGIIKRISGVLGVAPAPVPLRWDMQKQVNINGVSVELLAYDSCDGEKIRALLLKPESFSGKLPAIIALHPTDIAYADSLIVDRPGSDENYPYAMELARLGFAVIAPDLFTSGHFPNAQTIEKGYDTCILQEKHPQWSAMGRALYDHQIALDLLCSLPFVDAKRIGAIGHSLGGTNAFFLTAFDKRIKAAAVSCCLSAFCCHPNIRVWSREKGFCYFPSLRRMIDDGYVPFEWYELIAAAAPNPMNIFQAKKDEWFARWDSAVQSCRRAGEVYALYRQSEMLRLELGETVHSFPESARNSAYHFLKAVLMEDSR